MIRRTVVIISALLIFTSCGNTELPKAKESAVNVPEPSLAPTFTAKTAYIILRSKAELDGYRIQSIEAPSAPRGFSTHWDITVVSINENWLMRYRVTAPEFINEPYEESYNAVFDNRPPPFTEEVWELDSSELIRDLNNQSPIKNLYLEANDMGIINWEITLSDGSRQTIMAGETPLDTPPPSFEKNRN